MIKLDTKVQFLSGVGPVMAKKLERLGIENIRDLLFYYPRRFNDFSKPQNIKDLFIGQDAIIKAKVFQIKQSRTRRKWMSIVEASLIDDTGEIKAIWFNQPYLIKILTPGSEWLFAGKIGFDRQNQKKTISIYQIEKGPAIFPVYSETQGLTSKFIRKIISTILNNINSSIEDYLPEEIKKNENFISIEDALIKIHSPKNNVEIIEAKKRLAFDELFLIATRLQLVKKELRQENAPKMEINEKILKRFVSELPFQLTKSQKISAWEIIKDLNKNVPMNRLLEGDVGSGKTVVGAMAVMTVANSHYQSVWLAPTEILANQHYKNCLELFKQSKIKVGLFTSANKKADLNKDDLIIGTHALLQKEVKFPRLGLIIIDEQHRFGVKQRSHLRSQNGYIPHLLSMTATPIPRTLALALYGDLEISIINELPKDRQKIITKVVESKDRNKAYEFIENEIKKGRQAFVICPLIEDKDKNKINLFDVDKKSVIAEFHKLNEKIFPDLKIGLLHGKLRSKEKEHVMNKFSQKKLDILVSTAVVEVGIDIPNATVMMIEGAENFGLAQLHQFRGRVGRGKHQSYCFLFSENSSENTKKILSAMVDCDNGFELAEIDLKLRGPGELIGIRQSGLPDLKMASLSDTILVKKASSWAEKIVNSGIEKYPKLDNKISEFETEHHLE